MPLDPVQHTVLCMHRKARDSVSYALKEDVFVGGDPEEVLVLYCGPWELQMSPTSGS